jgi:hypothetical protein
MGQEEMPNFMGAIIAAVILGAMITAGIVLVAVFLLL